jgi:hypothetical protein
MVYFVCRSEYERPHGRRIVEFPEASTLLEWFQRYWLTSEELERFEPRIAQAPEFDAWDWQDQIHALREDAFGGSFYALGSFLIPMLERQAPTSIAEVQEFIESFGGSYSEGTIEFQDGAIQAVTDDDEIDIAWYLFDSDFAEKHPERVSFLIRREFELPDQYDQHGWHPQVPCQQLGHGNGGTYCCFLSAQDGMTITEIDGCYRLPARLPEAGAWLANQCFAPGEEKMWPDDLKLLRAFALKSGDSSLDHPIRLFDALENSLREWLPWVCASHRYKAKNPQFLLGSKEECTLDLESLSLSSIKSGQKQPGNYWIISKAPSLIQFSPHLCQIVFTSILNPHDAPEKKKYHIRHWIFFDALWAAANRDLAESILRYGRGYNVLGE